MCGDSDIRELFRWIFGGAVEKPGGEFGCRRRLAGLEGSVLFVTYARYGVPAPCCSPKKSQLRVHSRSGVKMSWFNSAVLSLYVLRLSMLIAVVCIDYRKVQIYNSTELEMWANAQRDGRPADYRWRPLFNAAKFG